MANADEVTRLKRENNRLRLALVKVREILAEWQVDLKVMNKAGIRTMLRMTERALKPHG